METGGFPNQYTAIKEETQEWKKLGNPNQGREEGKSERPLVEG